MCFDVYLKFRWFDLFSLRGGVQLFNRGTTEPTGPQLYGDSVEHLVGDRRTADGLAALREGTWDVCVDCAGYLASEVRASVDLLAGRVKTCESLAPVCRSMRACGTVLQVTT